MADRDPFGDVELMLEHYLGTTKKRGYVVTYTPPDLRAVLNDDDFVVRVVRSGGGEVTNSTTDAARVVMHVHGLNTSTNPRATQEHAAKIRADMMNLPAVTPHGRLDKAITESGPVEVPHPDQEVTRIQMIFRVSTRR